MSETDPIAQDPGALDDLKKVAYLNPTVAGVSFLFASKHAEP
jgi:hypothetical protein